MVSFELVRIQPQQWKSYRGRSDGAEAMSTYYETEVLVWHAFVSLKRQTIFVAARGIVEVLLEAEVYVKYQLFISTSHIRQESSVHQSSKHLTCITATFTLLFKILHWVFTSHYLQSGYLRLPL